ncbi:hypothetical protein D770_15295 [Flammeovirgaceae bacterium 311]|nr:hypothetical protein D770_15295 [Flammeovirgaceae bacterium 311]
MRQAGFSRRKANFIENAEVDALLIFDGLVRSTASLLRQSSHRAAILPVIIIQLIKTVHKDF